MIYVTYSQFFMWNLFLWSVIVVRQAAITPLKEHYEPPIVDDGSQTGSRISRHIFLCTEGYAELDNVIKYYDVGVDFPFNFALVNWSIKSKASDLRRWVSEWMKRMPHNVTEAPKKRKHDDDGHMAGRWPNWVAGNHDQSRPATRLGGQKYANIVNALLLTLPGTPTCYQGDELGMLDVPVTFEQCQDPYGKRFGPDRYAEYTRDPCRSPMIWESKKKNGDFTKEDVVPWLPLSKNRNAFAVDVQKTDPKSYLNFFRRLYELRDREPIFHRYGHNIRILAENDEEHFVYERFAPEDSDINHNYLIILNVSQDSDGKSFDLDLSKEIDNDRKATVLISTIDDQETKTIDLSSIKTKAADVMILRYDKESPKRQKVHE